MNQELVSYIKSAKEHGLSDAEVKQNLLNAGWESSDIEDAFSHYVASLNYPVKQAETDQSMLSPIMQRPAEKPQALVQNSQKVLVENPVSTPLEQASTGKKSYWGLWILLIIFLCAVGAGGFYVYTYGFYTPSQLWKKFSQSPKEKVYQNKFVFNYNDSSEPEADTQNMLGFNIKKLNLSLDGSYYVNIADSEHPESSSEVKYTVGSGGTDFSTSFKYILKNQILYLNVGSNPILDLITQGLAQQNGGKKLDWMKLDFEELSKAGSQTSSQDSKDMEKFKSIFNSEFKGELEKIWNDTTIVKIKKTIGHEKINGIQTLHYENELDKTALKSVLNTYVDKIVDAIIKSGLETEPPKRMDLVHKVVSGLVDKLEIKQFETWVGVKNYQLYRVKLVSNAPSLLSLTSNALLTLKSARSTARDAKRLADVRQMASALELYYNDMSGYPESKDGKPLNITPNYIGALPQTPTPADGQCSEYYNTYWYTAKGQKKVVNGKSVYSDYQLDFCLGAQTGGYNAGIAKLTPSGIDSGLDCKDSPEHCKPSAVSSEGKLADDQQMQKVVDDFLANLKFSAEFNILADYSEFGKIRAIDEPKEFYDLTQLLTSAQGSSRDSKRIADVRQLASALELYFNDKNEYPKKLDDMTPTYMGVIPTAPSPADGNCQNSDNQYSYQRQDSSHYVINFCLGVNTGGYSAGKHLLTPAGIQ